MLSKRTVKKNFARQHVLILHHTEMSHLKFLLISKVYYYTKFRNLNCRWC